jgi:O-antigen/teichoic acid export membrane protein
LVLSNVGQFLTTKLDNFILAKFVSPATLGQYVVAFEISNLPTSNLIAPMQTAIFSGFSKIAHDRQRLVSAYLDAMALLLMLAVPVGVGIWLTADSLVYVMLGPKWLPVIALLQILAIYGLARLAYANTRSVYLALGRPSFVTYTTGMQLALQAPALFYGVSTAGAVGAAWALVVSTAVTGLANLYIVARMLGISFRQTLKAVWRTLGAAAGMIVVGVLLRPSLPAADGFAAASAALIAMVAGCGAAFVVGQAALWLLCGRPPGAEAYAFNLLREQMRQHFRRTS